MLAANRATEGIMRNRALLGVALAAALLAGPAGAQSHVSVSTGWLAQHLRDPNLVLLHVGDEKQFKAGHIPGARFIRLQDISTSQGGLSLEMLPAAELRQRLQALGVTDRSHIVIYYGDDWVSPAARILFTLDAAGLGSRTELLDGGMRKWRKEGGAVTGEATAPARPGALAAFTLHAPIVDAAFVQAHAGRPGFALIDARAPVYYNGLEQSGAHEHMRRGHIPGAHNLPFDSVTNDDLTLKTPAQLRAMFSAAGVRPGDRVIAYCHVGQQATAVVAAARVAGIDALLYDGSFEDWTTRNLPVEQ
jgi:thiosulfate/3-mercaptopyruvate sulfurtransferase